MNPATESRSRKLLKSEVKFEHPGMGKDKCGDCKFFLPEAEACQIVRGHIESKDWCDQFER